MVVNVAAEQRRSVRGKRLEAARVKRLERRDRSSWRGEPTAIYCRVSHVRDKDQTSVDRQESICRRAAKRLGLVLAPEYVLVDPNRSAWQRNRKRPKWDRLLELLASGQIRHVVVYHADRLMRQPRDLEDLLSIADEHNITLHGEANQRDLSDPDDRFFLRIEVAHACRSSDDTSRRLRDAMVDRAHDGKPHTGKRRYGYAPNAVDIVPAEKKIIREVYKRYLAGESTYAIAHDLNMREVPTATGRTTWRRETVLSLLDSRHVAGIRVFRGEEIGRGEWKPIISMSVWKEVRARRAYRDDAVAVTPEKKHRYYVLRGLLVCGRCGIGMAGSSGKYQCNRRDMHRSNERHCRRVIHAAMLEDFVIEAALRRLESITANATADAFAGDAVSLLSESDRDALAEDEQELAELKAAWDAREIKTGEYREMRKKVQARIDAIRARTVIRPTAEVLQGVIGTDARAAWQRLVDAGEYARMNAILRFLFAAVVIGESAAGKGRFDYDRITIEANPL